MSYSVDSLLRDLQGAASVSALYPPDHPRATELRRRVVAAVDALTHATHEIAVFTADDRLIVDGRVWPHSEHLARGVFGSLAQLGWPRIVLRRGLTDDELARFLADLGRVRHSPAARGQLSATEHVRLSTAAAGPLVGGPTVAWSGEQTPPLVAAWSALVNDQRFDMDVLHVIVTSLAAAVDEHGHALVPLAQLRSHDEYTVTHITNVATLAMALGGALGLSAGPVTELGIAALLHDVGKLRVPKEILNFEGRLDETQADIVRRHPAEGARILLATPGVPDLAPIVAYEHHLHYDGGGYPSVPAHWKVNAASHVTMIADVYDALRTDRPYRKGLTPDRIESIMTAEAGTVFNPAMLEVFFERVVPRVAAATVSETSSPAAAV